MSTLDFLTSLRERGVVVRLAPEGTSLAVSAPKGALDDASRAELAARKDEILRFLSDAAAGAEAAVAPLEPRDPDAPLRLSAAQERVWNLHRLSRGDAGLNIPVAWKVSGAVDTARLATALAGVVARHDTLRCRFTDGDPQPTVTIVDDAAPVVETIEIVDGADPIDTVTEFCEAPFDLESQVMRVGVADLDDDTSILATSFHQIVFDWGAANPFVAELSAFYDAAADPDQAPLDAIEIGYLDFAAWQHEWLAASATSDQESYWSSQLERPYSALALPRGATDPVGEAETHRHRFAVDRATTEALRGVAQASGATMFMTLLGTWQALLAGHSDAEEALTFTMMGLNRPELKRLVGLFANPLPLRVDLSGDPTSTELGRRVSEVAVGAFQHQDLPLDRVIERAGAVAPAGQAGLFQTLFIFQHEPTTPLRLADAETELVTLGSHAPGFELRLFAEETDDGVHGWLEHSSDRLDAPHGRRLLDAYVDTLAAVAAAPDAPISSVLAVSDADRAEAAADASTELVTEYAAPTNDIERGLAEIWAEAFGREMGIDDDFFASGGHSLLAVSIFTEVQKRFDRDLPLATLFEAPTIRRLATVVDDAEWQLEWTSLVPIKPTGSKTPIFCVAALGDEIIQFAELADLLDADQPFYALQQGLERTDVIRTTIPEIAAHYLAEVRTVQPSGPYVLAGYCWGALVAYEMTQQLEAEGEQLDVVLMVEGEAPGGMYPVPQTIWQRLRNTMKSVTELGPIGSVRYAAKRLGKLWRWTIWTRLRHYLHAGFDRLGISLPDSLKDILQINAQAADDYAPNMVPYDGDIHVLRAEGMAAGFVFEERLGWDRLVTGEISEHWLPGDHEGIWKTPNVQVFAKQLEAILDTERTSA